MRRTKSHPAQCAALIAPRHAVSGRPWNIAHCRAAAIRACPNSSKTSSMRFSNVASLPTTSCGCAAPGAATRSWWRFPASGVAFAPRAGHAAWRRAPPGWLIELSPRGQCANGCSRSRSRCPVLQIIHRVIATHLIRQAGVKPSEAAAGAARGTFSGGLIRERGADGRARRALVPEWASGIAGKRLR